MSDRMVWVDLETTGLSPEMDQILELGIVITDYDLEVIDSKSWVFNPFPGLVEDAFQFLDSIVVEMHTNNGLWEDIKQIPFRPIYEVGVALEIKNYLESSEATGLPMCGSTIQFDRAFLKLHAPEIEALFHYRNIDVSTVKNLYNIDVERFNQTPQEGPENTKAHRVISDCLDSIRELKFYREINFVGTTLL